MLTATAELASEFSAFVNETTVYAPTRLDRAADTRFEGDRGLDLPELSNDTWRYLGSGCERSAWLHILSNEVYKISHDGDDGNSREHKNANLLRDIFINTNIVIPQTALFGDVLVMEYFGDVNQSKTYRLSIDRLNFSTADSMAFHRVYTDLHSRNYVAVGNKIVLIDLGFAHDFENAGPQDPIRPMLGGVEVALFVYNEFYEKFEIGGLVE